jgi:hypothetical protein
LEEGNFRRVAKSLSLAESDEKVPQPCDIRSSVGFSLRNWFIGRRLKPTLRLQKKGVECSTPFEFRKFEEGKT